MMRIGIYQVYWGRVGGGQRYIGVVAQLLARDHHVEIVHHRADLDCPALEEGMGLDLSRVSFRFVPPVDRPTWTTRNPIARLRLERGFRAEISQPYDLFIDNSDLPPLFCHARRGVLVVHFPLVKFEEFHGHSTEAWKLRSAPLRWAAGLSHRREWRQRLGSYDRFLVNSAYGQRWLKRLWGVDADILNPPLREGIEPHSKERLILSIGAFRSGQHKKHAVTIDVFKKLCDRGLADWRYKLVGACGPDRGDRDYLADLRERAAGYPIEFRADASGSELKLLLERSAILWHSMGYGVDEERDPKLMEHFGMVAIEAMAAGAVPIVYNGGGLREIVCHGQTGLLWNTTEELADATITFVRDARLQERLRVNAIEEATRYSTDAFAGRLLEVLAPVLG